MGAPSTFTVATLVEQGGQLVPGSPVLELEGRALPYQPFTLEGAARVETTWYPGNPVATLQVLGTEERPASVAGQWKDRFLKSATDEGIAVRPPGAVRLDGAPLEDSAAAVAAVERFRLACLPVEVRWDALTRRGLLTRFRQTWIRREDVEWEMEFTWASRGEQQAPPVLPASPSPGDFAGSLRGLTDALHSALESPPFQAIEDFTSAVEAAVAEVEEATQALEDAAEEAAGLVLAPADAALRCLAAVETIKGSAREVVALVDSWPPAELVKTGDVSALGLGEVLAAARHVLGVKAAARGLATAAAEQGGVLRASAAQEDVVAVHAAREGEDLRGVSQRYYGTPHEWRRLAKRNQLEGSALSAGQVVLVPRIGAADRGA